MAIKKIKIKNFKCFKEWFTVEFNNNFNIIVGDNDVGKSTILEALNLALTGNYRGKNIKNELSQYLFNKDTIKEYLEKHNNLKSKDSSISLPEIIIEVYFEKDMHPNFLGDGNSEKSKDDSGFIFKICFDERYSTEYKEIYKSEITSIPIEYYDVSWMSFSREVLTPRTINIKSCLIDSSNYRFSNGSDVYISRIIKNILEDKDIVGISKAHRLMKESFNNDDIIKEVNTKLKNSIAIDNKNIGLSVDLGTKNSWENSLITELNDIPYINIGKGNQCIIKTKLALSSKKSEDSDIILIEEPESHLSYSNLNILLETLEKNHKNKQIILSTHSSFVANKLGIENLLLLSNSNIIKINELSNDTKKYFKKIKGYDTLRLILCKCAILVEGDSDELIVQKAYKDKYDKLPIQDGIDVISVGTAFLRFLELADKLNKNVCVVTDNDGNICGLQKKYSKYKNKDNIKIYYDLEEHEYEGEIKDYNYNTLEPCILRANSLELLNSILKTNFSTEDELLKHMKDKKTLVAISIFDTKEENIKYPDYIEEAIKWAVNYI